MTTGLPSSCSIDRGEFGILCLAQADNNGETGCSSPQRGRMSAQLTGEGEYIQLLPFLPPCSDLTFSLITRFAGVSPAGGSTATDQWSALQQGPETRRAGCPHPAVTISAPADGAIMGSLPTRGTGLRCHPEEGNPMKNPNGASWVDRYVLKNGMCAGGEILRLRLCLREAMTVGTSFGALRHLSALWGRLCGQHV